MNSPSVRGVGGVDERGSSGLDGVGRRVGTVNLGMRGVVTRNSENNFVLKIQNGENSKVFYLFCLEKTNLNR